MADMPANLKPNGDEGLCLTMVFDWLKFYTADFKAFNKDFFTDDRAKDRLKRFNKDEIAERHALNRRALGLCDTEHLESIALVYSAYINDADLNGGTGTFTARSKTWKPWTNVLRPYADLSDHGGGPTWFLLATRPAKTASSYHAMGAFYNAFALGNKEGHIKKLVTIFDPNAGEYLSTVAAIPFWTQLKKENGPTDAAEIAVFEYDANKKFTGNLKQLMDTGVIHPPKKSASDGKTN